MYITNYPVFFQCYFRSGTEILMAVCSFWIFFQESFLDRGFHMNGTLGIQWGIHSSALMVRRGDGKKIHGAGGTPIMPLLTRTNPGLCCNRIKKKHELQYALENLQEKDLNFTRKGTSSQINFP